MQFLSFFEYKQTFRETQLIIIVQIISRMADLHQYFPKTPGHYNSIHQLRWRNPGSRETTNNSNFSDKLGIEPAKVITYASPLRSSAWPSRYPLYGMWTHEWRQNSEFKTGKAMTWTPVHCLKKTFAAQLKGLRRQGYFSENFRAPRFFLFFYFQLFPHLPSRASDFKLHAPSKPNTSPRTFCLTIALLPHSSYLATRISYFILHTQHLISQTLHLRSHISNINSPTSSIWL